MNDHVGPIVLPTLFFAVTDHVYGVTNASDESATEVLVRFVAYSAPFTYTSYACAPASLHVSVTFVLTPVAPSAGDGANGADGAVAGGAACVCVEFIAVFEYAELPALLNAETR